MPKRKSQPTAPGSSRKSDPPKRSKTTAQRSSPPHPATLASQCPSPPPTAGYQVYQTPDLRHHILSLLSPRDLGRFICVEKKVVCAVAQLLYREVKYDQVYSLGSASERRRIYRDSVRIIDMRDQPPRPACLKDHFPHHPPPHPLASLYDPDGIVPLVESLRKIFPDVEKLYFGNTPSLSQYQYDAYTVTLDPAPVDDLTSTSNRPKRGAKPTPITGHIELEWTLKRSDLPMGSAHVLQPQAPDGFTLNSIAKVSTKYAQAWKWQRLARNVSALPCAISKWDSTPIMFSPTELGNIIKHIGKNKALLPDLCEFRCSIPPDWSIADLEACLARSNDAFASLTLVANRNERALAMSVNNLPRILNAVGRDTPALRKLHLHLQVRQDAVSMMNEWTISDAPDFVDSDGGTSTVDGLVGKCKPQSERTNGRDHALEVSLSIRWWRLEPLDMDDDAHRVKFTDIFQPIVKWLERNSEADSLWVEVHGIDQFNAQFRREPCGTLREVHSGST